MTSAWHPANSRTTKRRRLSIRPSQWDGIAVIVNIANPADDLTVEQVASIFLGDVTKWNEIVK